MIDKTNPGRATGEILRRRGIALSSHGIDRFLFARRRLAADSRASRHPTLAECASRAKVGLRTLTRCLRGERVDRRSIELIFIGVGLELEAQDLMPGHLDPLTFAPRSDNRPLGTSALSPSSGPETYA